jgi:hypothetical protein
MCSTCRVQSGFFEEAIGFLRRKIPTIGEALSREWCSNRQRQENERGLSAEARRPLWQNNARSAPGRRVQQESRTQMGVGQALMNISPH